jgi:phosphoribosyl-ATP pyrophosphohydrolase
MAKRLATDEPLSAIDRLFQRIEAARTGDPDKSYTARLFQRGRAKIAQKLGEEAVEAVIELMREDKRALISESADLVYHLLVAWSAAGIRPDEIWAELERREAMGGLAEKSGRKPG